MHVEQAIRVVAIDDDPMVLDLVRVMLKAAPDIELVGTANDGDEAVSAVIAHHPDVVLMDVRMQRVGGIEATKSVMARPAPPRIIILTTFDEEQYVPRAMDAGAVGFVLKASAREELYAAIRAAHAGGSPMSSESAGHLRRSYLAGGGASARLEARERVAGLSEREREIAHLVADEYTNAQIARRLHISESTVKQTITSLQNKLGVSGRVGIATAVARAE